MISKVVFLILISVSLSLAIKGVDLSDDYDKKTFKCFEDKDIKFVIVQA